MNPAPALSELTDHRKPDWERSFEGGPPPQSRGVDSSCPDTTGRPILVDCGRVSCTTCHYCSEKMCSHTDKLSCQKGCYFWVKGDSAERGSFLPAATRARSLSPDLT